MSILPRLPQPAGKQRRAPSLDRWQPIGNTVGMAKIDPSLYVTIGNAARIADVDRFWMRQLVKAGKISGVEIDGQWFALRSAVEKYQRSDTGRPRLPRAAKSAGPKKA
jgi:hypothetical protein